jgi:hypothetical protein
MSPQHVQESLQMKTVGTPWQRILTLVTPNTVRLAVGLLSLTVVVIGGHPIPNGEHWN